MINTERILDIIENNKPATSIEDRLDLLELVARTAVVVLFDTKPDELFDEFGAVELREILNVTKPFQHLPLERIYSKAIYPEGI